MAYNTNAPFGLRPVMHLNGAPWNGAYRVYNIASAYATGLFSGDPVTTLTDGTIGIGVAGSAIRGIFWGCQYFDTLGNLQNSKYWPASTVAKTGTTPIAYVIDDATVVFTAQEDNGSGAAGTALALADRGLNINFAIGAGSTSNGLSTSTINNGSENTTSTLNCKIIDLDPRPGNAVGDFANWYVSINNHQLGSVGTTGV